MPAACVPDSLALKVRGSTRILIEWRRSLPLAEVRTIAMRGALGGPRVLLRRLREVMAEPVSAQERLDKIVVLIAANMVAEVCSAMCCASTTLELYAPEGLNRTRCTTVLNAMRACGLVSSEASPLNLSDTQSHPAFSFRPETGEEIYHSFLGVPILRAGNTLGVLVVQNRAKRTYVEEEVEALQTTAMVLAEMIASGELAALAQPGAEPAARHSLHKTASILSDGTRSAMSLHEPRVVITQLHRRRPDRRKSSGWSGADQLRRSRPHAGARRCRRGRRASRRAEAYRMFRQRPRLVAPSCTRRSPPASPRKPAREQSDTRARMLRSTDPYLRDRLRSRGSRPPPDAQLVDRITRRRANSCPRTPS
jgi:phosphotransferase system enzyme I (PtsP)